jgi:hypothetical protein
VNREPRKEEAFDRATLRRSFRPLAMKTLLSVLALTSLVSGCTVLSVTGSVVSTGVSVAATAVETGVSVAGSAVRGVASAVTPSDK